jgi:hypothetical protein
MKEKIMLQYLKGFNKKVEINGEELTVDELINKFSATEGAIKIKVLGMPARLTTDTDNPIKEVQTEKIYRIKVRQYMTKPPVPEFDFHTKWNNGIAMPFRIMTGKKIKETKGMVMMELWAEMEGETMTTCMKCGRILTNNVSKYFGIGPECGSHDYTNPFATESELKEAVAEVKKQLMQVRWIGWVIKSALLSCEVIREE